MKNSIFDEQLDRSTLSTMKWEAEIARTGDSNLLSFGTADMDFRSPKPVLDAIHKVAESGHLGYPFIQDSYYEAIQNWFLRTTGWKINVRTCCDVNVGIYTSVWTILNALTKPGDEIIIQTPVHFSFGQTLQDNGRVAVSNPLVYKDGAYRMDYDHLESLFTSKTKIFWLCNPHNPVGRAWTTDELRKIGDICLRKGITILSDDVYCGLIFPGHTYTPIASLSKELSQITITCYSPSKCYNTTGIKFSFVVTENLELMQQYHQSLSKLVLHYGVNIIGLAVAEAAYNDCDPWLTELMQYIKESHRILIGTVAKEMLGASVAVADSTYFGWIDFRCLQIPSSKLVELFEKEAHVIVNDGAPLGAGGEGFIRMNLACPHRVLKEGLARMVETYRQFL